MSEEPRRQIDEGPGDLFVFLPGLMGAGILLSGAILLADGVRKLAPNRGVRRRVNVARGVRGVVAGAARAAGQPVPQPELGRREPRSRWSYLVLGAALGAMAGVFVRAGLDAYLGRGTMYHNSWALGIWIGMGAALAMLAILGFALAGPAGERSVRLRRVVDATWLGRLRPPPEDRHQRAHLLIPSFEEGEIR